MLHLLPQAIINMFFIASQYWSLEQGLCQIIRYVFVKFTKAKGSCQCRFIMAEWAKISFDPLLGHGRMALSYLNIQLCLGGNCIVIINKPSQNHLKTSNNTTCFAFKGLTRRENQEESNLHVMGVKVNTWRAKKKSTLKNSLPILHPWYTTK
jgi:hypothetical protein